MPTRVRYGDPAEARVPMAKDGPKLGLVIYLKSAMIRDLSLTSRGYKGANPDFPYELTADQFFSPEQFEAYRDVGMRTAEQMLKETSLPWVWLNRWRQGVQPPHISTASQAMSRGAPALPFSTRLTRSDFTRRRPEVPVTVRSISVSMPRARARSMRAGSTSVGRRR